MLQALNITFNKLLSDKDMRKSNIVKTTALTLALCCATSAFAGGFKVPPYYSIELVDGATSNFNYDKSTRTLSLEPGRHQIVLSFEGTFGSSRESSLVESSNPIVIDIHNLGADETLSFSYKIPQSLEEASKYARTQVIELNDGKTKVAGDKATYFILQSDSGFSIFRDYRQDLLSVNRLYAPNYVEGSDRTMGLTSYGAPTITATNNMSIGSNSAPANITMPAPGVSSSQNAVMQTSAVGGGAAAVNVKLNDLINLYNSADDKTRLEFVKYVMSH